MDYSNNLNNLFAQIQKEVIKKYQTQNKAQNQTQKQAQKQTNTKKNDTLFGNKQSTKNNNTNANNQNDSSLYGGLVDFSNTKNIQTPKTQNDKTQTKTTQNKTNKNSYYQAAVQGYLNDLAKEVQKKYNQTNQQKTNQTQQTPRNNTQNTTKQETPTVNTKPVTETKPSVETKPTVKDNQSVNTNPTVDTTPSIDTTPTVNDNPAVNDTPTVNETPAVNDNPTVNDNPAVNDTSDINITSKIEVINFTHPISKESAIAINNCLNQFKKEVPLSEIKSFGKLSSIEDFLDDIEHFLNVASNFENPIFDVEICISNNKLKYISGSDYKYSFEYNNETSTGSGGSISKVKFERAYDTDGTISFDKEQIAFNYIGGNKLESIDWMEDDEYKGKKVGNYKTKILFNNDKSIEEVKVNNINYGDIRNFCLDKDGNLTEFYYKDDKDAVIATLDAKNGILNYTSNYIEGWGVSVTDERKYIVDKKVSPYDIPGIPDESFKDDYKYFRLTQSKIYENDVLRYTYNIIYEGDTVSSIERIEHCFNFTEIEYLNGYDSYRVGDTVNIANPFNQSIIEKINSGKSYNDVEIDVLINLITEKLDALKDSEFYNTYAEEINNFISSDDVNSEKLYDLLDILPDANNVVGMNQQGGIPDCWLLSAAGTKYGENIDIVTGNDNNSNTVKFSLDKQSITVTDKNGTHEISGIYEITVNNDEFKDDYFVGKDGTTFKISSGDDKLQAMEVAFFRMLEQNNIDLGSLNINNSAANGLTLIYGEADCMKSSVSYYELGDGSSIYKDVATRLGFDNAILRITNQSNLISNKDEYEKFKEETNKTLLEFENIENLVDNSKAVTANTAFDNLKLSERMYSYYLDDKKTILKNIGYDKKEVNEAIEICKDGRKFSEDTKDGSSTVTIPTQDGTTVDIYGSHVYTVVDAKSGYVELRNPHDNSKTFKIKEVYFKILFNELGYVKN